jgi:probable phosphoglycerate mutase
MSHDRATRILALRHGETDWNVDARIQGQLDIGLNDEGRAQAELLASALIEEPITAIYCSDLSRARATAEALSRATGLPLQLDAGLRERDFGVFQGRTVSEIERDHPLLALRWRLREPDFAPEGGETLNEFFERCVTTAVAIATRHPDQTIAVVSHGGVLDCLYRAANGMSLQAQRSWQLGNASINRLLFTDQGLSIIGWGDDTHLDGSVRDEVQDSRA